MDHTLGNTGLGVMVLLQKDLTGHIHEDWRCEPVCLTVGVDVTIFPK